MKSSEKKLLTKTIIIGLACFGVSGFSPAWANDYNKTTGTATYPNAVVITTADTTSVVGGFTTRVSSGGNGVLSYFKNGLSMNFTPEANYAGIVLTGTGAMVVDGDLTINLTGAQDGIFDNGGAGTFTSNGNTNITITGSGKGIHSYGTVTLNGATNNITVTGDGFGINAEKVVATKGTTTVNIGSGTGVVAGTANYDHLTVNVNDGKGNGITNYGTSTFKNTTVNIYKSIAYAGIWIPKGNASFENLKLTVHTTDKLGRGMEIDRGATSNLSGENTIDTTDNVNGWSSESVYLNGGTLNLLAGGTTTLKTSNDAGIEQWLDSSRLNVYGTLNIIKTNNGGSYLKGGPAGIWQNGGVETFYDGSVTNITLQDNATGTSGIKMGYDETNPPANAVANYNSGSKLNITSNVKNTQGIYVYSSSKTGSNTLNFNGTGTVTMNEGGEGVLVEGSKSTGNFSNMAVTTKSTQDTSRGYHVKDNGTLTITGGSIDTSGSNAIADAQGILVDNATFTQSTTSPTIKVNNAAGLEVINNSTANLNTDFNITKIGYGSAGLVATSGTINLNSGTTTVNLNDNATDSAGLLVSAPADSTATANVAGGTMVINTSNSDTSAMHVFSMASGGASTLTGTPTIILNGADGGVVVEGAQASANLDALTITDNNAQATGLYGTNSSTTNISGMTTINGAATGAKADSDATVNIAGAQIKAATALAVGEGSATLNVNSAGGNTVNIVGNLLGSGKTVGSVMNVNLDSASTSVTGAATSNLQTINMSLANSGVWNMTGTSTVTNLTSDSGIINMRASSITGDTYETLTTNTYTANNGNLIMDTDLNSESTGDKLYIKNSSSGSSTIQIHDASLLNDTEVTGVKNLLLVDGATEGTTFVGKNLDAGGLWESTPTIKVGTQALDANGNPVGTANQWYLTTIAKKVNKDTSVLLKDAINTHTSWLWRNTNDTLRQRLGDLRRDKYNETGEGVWARYRNGRYDGSGLAGSYGLFQVGYDKKLNHSAAFGLAYETGAGRASYDYGRSEETVNDFSIYGTWYGKDGVYTDLIGSAGLIEDETSSFGNYPDKFTSREHAFKISLEHGKTIPFGKDKRNFFEPQAQIILSRLNGRNYDTDRKTNVDISATNSLVGRLGFVLGRKTPDKNDIYLKASVLREFAGRQDMNLAAYNGEHMHFHNDYGETWWEVGVGGNWNLSKVSHLYADVERSFGASVEKTVQINAGLRFEF